MAQGGHASSSLSVSLPCRNDLAAQALEVNGPGFDFKAHQLLARRAGYLSL